VKQVRVRTEIMLWGSRWGIGRVGPSPPRLLSCERCRWLGELLRQSEHSASDVHFSRTSWQLLTCVWPGLRCTGDDWV